MKMKRAYPMQNSNDTCSKGHTNVVWCFTSSGPGGKRPKRRCRECANVSRQTWSRNNPDKERAWRKAWESRQAEPNSGRVRRYQEKRRLELFMAYGNRCECCGESNHAFLSIDHINGGGRRHRAEIGSGNLYGWLKARGYPTDNFRLLCYNCNLALGHRGFCPHQALRDLVGETA
jgi:hypothetical protein